LSGDKPTLMNRRVRHIEVQRVNGSPASTEKDFLAVEEPLEIRVEGHSVAVVMRTPGEDRELAAGFLLSEGLIRSKQDVTSIRYQPHCMRAVLSGPAPAKKPATSSTSRVNHRTSDPKLLSSGSEVLAEDGNVINVRLRNPDLLDFGRLTRHLFTSSSCGICSKAAIEAVQQQFGPIEGRIELNPKVLLGLPDRLASVQETFQRTGGLHASALFDLSGNLCVVREDVGRHNSLDTVIGWALLKGCLPLRQHILLLSGRISFELVQKALAAGIPIIAAISAPSSLAVEFAKQSGQTLVGFLRGQRMNVYAGGERLQPQRTQPRSLTTKNSQST